MPGGSGVPPLLRTLLMEVALLTDLVRELADRVRQLEGKQ
jgi:hypothetical protein